jgi:hypothetical protein
MDDGRPRRSAPFSQEPGFYEEGNLWLYGNVRVLQGRLAYIEYTLWRRNQHCLNLDEIEMATEQLVLNGEILVCGIHNEGHRQSALVPLRWGSPRILILSGGFHHHLGPKLDQEPFLTARLWRYQFDPVTDLVISRRAPNKKPTFASYNPTVDRLIKGLVECSLPGFNTLFDPLSRLPLLAS